MQKRPVVVDDDVVGVVVVVFAVASRHADSKMCGMTNGCGISPLCDVTERHNSCLSPVPHNPLSQVSALPPWFSVESPAI